MRQRLQSSAFSLENGNAEHRRESQASAQGSTNRIFMVKHCRHKSHFLMCPSLSLIRCCPTLLSDFKQSNGPKSSPGNGRLGGSKPLYHRLPISHAIYGRTGQRKLVSRFTRMHQAAHAEPHLLCHKAAERKNKRTCFKMLLWGSVYTSVRLRYRKI